MPAPALRAPFPIRPKRVCHPFFFFRLLSPPSIAFINQLGLNQFPLTTTCFSLTDACPPSPLRHSHSADSHCHPLTHQPRPATPSIKPWARLDSAPAAKAPPNIGPGSRAHARLTHRLWGSSGPGAGTELSTPSLPSSTSTCRFSSLPPPHLPLDPCPSTTRNAADHSFDTHTSQHGGSAIQRHQKHHHRVLRWLFQIRNRIRGNFVPQTVLHRSSSPGNEMLTILPPRSSFNH